MRTQNATRSSARGAVSGPDRSVDYAELDLAGLRAYRHTLLTEEERVSYWRRLIQSRIDIVHAGEGVVLLGRDNLGSVLAADQVGRGRVALMSLLPASRALPPLPQLASLWARRADPGDPLQAAELLADLMAAEHELSTYRASLHEMLGAATDELIARYREHPLDCLVALPLPAGDEHAARV